MESKYDKNRRLEKILHQLEATGVLVKKHNSKLAEGEYNRKTLSQKLGTYTGVIPAILKDERFVTETIIKNLCDHFGVSELYVRMGQGPMFKNNGTEKILPYTKSNIVYSGVSAIAGDAIAGGGASQAEVFGIPGLEGNIVAFDVKGNSMEPLLTSGDMVFCKEVENARELRKDEVYAVVADGTVRIKYIQLTKDDYGRVRGLKLISENHLEHSPIFVDLNDNIRIYRVMYYLTDLRERLGFL